MKSCIFFVLVFGTLFFCSKKNPMVDTILAPEDLLLKDNEISGWERSGQCWVASSYGELTNYINGEAVIYTSRGFVESAFQIYQGSVLENTETVELRIFDQGNQKNAESVFDELVNQMSSPIEWDPGVGEQAKIERFPLAQRIIFWKSKYFIAFSISSGLEEALNVLKTFSINVDSKIE